MLHPAETAERIEVLFGLETLGDERNIVLDMGLDPSRRGEGMEFDAALAKLLWPLVMTIIIVL